MSSYDSYYPRSLLRRDSFFSLNGTWIMNGSEIEVPFCRESEINNLSDQSSEMVYEKSFSLPEGFVRENEKVILHFGAVDAVCDVYLNDSFLIHNEGGYLPFCCDITATLKEENLLRVYVKDELDSFYPFGKQTKKPSGMWYTPVSGIWQSVWIESYPADGIDSIQIETDRNSVHISIESSSSVFTVEFEEYKETFNSNDITFYVDNPHLWSCEDPYLYEMKIRSHNDVVSSYFALREIRTEDINGRKVLLLNDEPLFIRGLLDQGYWKKGIYTVEKPEDYETDILNMKELGFNLLRKHIKVEDDAFYYYCDKHGMLVMQDCVNSGKYHFLTDSVLPTIGITTVNRKIKDQRRFDFFINQSRKMIAHLKSHPSIIGYTIYNEGWGQQAASLCYDMLKPLDKNRLFDSTSGWFRDDHSDFDSYHIYFRNEVLPKSADRLLLLSECGGFTYAVNGHISNNRRYGYGKTKDSRQFTQAIISMIDKMVIPSMKNGLCGYILTQVSDVEGEINGLYTYDRQVCKAEKSILKEKNDSLDELYREMI